MEQAPDNSGDRNEKTAAIVKAARETFLARGFDAASMDHIALTAGVSKRTVYNRFRSKEELFGAAIEETCKNLLPVNIDEIEASLPPDEFIRALALQVVTGLLGSDSIALRRIAAFEAERTPAIGKSYIQHGPRWLVEHCASMLERLNDNGFLTIEDSHLAISQLGALITEPLFSYVLLGDAPEDLETAIERQVNSGVDAFLKIYATK